MENKLNGKKLFKKPEIEIITFTNEDIITSSGDLEDEFWGGDKN